MPGNVFTSQEIIDEIKAEALVEFEQLSRIYRPTFQTRKICDYLKQHIKELRPDIEVFEDCYRANLIDDANNEQLSSGNIWFDLPANDPQLEGNEPIILQGHMDMVCTYADEDTQRKMEESGVELEYHTNGTLTSRNNLTSLGADNGIGIAIMLAIVKSDTFKHGPIRFIVTTDEETGMSGATYLGLTKTGEKGGPVQGFKYLVNNDNAFDGEILLSTAGWVASVYLLPTEPDATPIDANLNIYTVTVTGLLGGHSGDWIAKRANAINIAGKIVKNVNKTSAFRLIEFTSPDSPNDNVMHTSSVVTFTSDLSYNDIISICQDVEAEFKGKFPEETGIKIKAEVSRLPENTEIRTFSHEASDRIVKLVNTIKCGVWSWKDQSIGWVETSGNLGPINMSCKKKQENGKDVWCEPSFELQAGFRSCNNEHVNQIATNNKQLAKEILGNDDLDYYRLKNLFYGWPGNDDPEFANIAKRAYETRGVKWTTRNLHGGLEVSWFKYFNPELNMLSIGAEIHNMHDNQETLYTGTLDGVIGVTLDCITQMRWITKK
ncbi:MAG: M20/M25/M40 family metallo-hydrolase [Mycoplasma sp.]|nr:M20/M25/M40 family metallo-hydrolase [Candidatus Hennigella equi]